MASPAEVANDLTAHANFYAGRDVQVERACRDTAQMIRKHLAGDQVDGRTWGGLHTRLLDLLSRYSSAGLPSIGFSLDRGLQTLYELRRGGSR